MSKAAELAALIGSQTALSNRNLIINGAMTVSQRGTSETGVTSGKYANAPDRFRIGMYDCGTWTASQSTTTPDGFANSYKLNCTTAKATLASDSNIQFFQRLEGQDLQQLQKGTSGAKSLTVSFYVRTNKTGTYTLELFDRDNNRVFSKTYSVSSADTWEYKSVTFEGDTTGAFDSDNAVSLDVSWWLAAGTDFTGGTFSSGWASKTDANRVSSSQVNIADSNTNEWYITGVQLEVGETATPFEHRSFGDALVACQRYYQAHGNGTNGLSFSIADMPASIATDTINITGKSFVKMMRAAPTMVIYSRNSTANKVSLVATGADYATSTFAPNIIGVTGFHLVSRSNGSNLTKGDGFEYGYTADAEL